MSAGFAVVALPTQFPSSWHSPPFLRIGCITGVEIARLLCGGDSRVRSITPPPGLSGEGDIHGERFAESEAQVWAACARAGHHYGVDGAGSSIGVRWNPGRVQLQRY